MAYLTADWVSYNDVGLAIVGLQYPAPDYDLFWFHNITTGATYSTTISFHAFYNLAENTTYVFEAEALYKGTWYPCGTTTVTTLYHVPPPTPPYPPRITSRFEGGLNLEWGYVSGVTGYRMRYKHYSGVYTEYFFLDNFYDLKNLEYGVTYYFQARSVDPYKYSDWTSESTGTTAPKTPTITQGSVTNNSVQINISGMQGNYDYVRVYCYDSGWNIIGHLDGYNGSSVTFTGLSNGGTYYFQAWSFLTVSGGTLQSVNYSQVTVTLKEPWSWSYTIASGQAVYSTVVSGGQIIAYIMPATEWNNFTARINSFRRYKGLPDYGSFVPIGSGSLCTLNTIAQAVYAINAMGFSLSISGSSIPASIFIQMRDALNSIQ